jgi:hypothetical protein
MLEIKEMYGKLKDKKGFCNELSKEECVYWLKKIYNDLKSARKIKSGIENYYLIENSFTNYYKAKTYDSLENYSYLVKKDNSFQALDKNTKILNIDFNKKNIHLLVNSKSTSDYKIELYHNYIFISK